MRIVLLANAEQKEELLAQGQVENIELIWLKDVSEANNLTNIDGCIDLLFDRTRERVEALKKLASSVTIIHSVITTLQELEPDFIRINGWTTFLKRPLVEAACKNESLKEKGEQLFSLFNKKMEWVEDIVGFISPRVVALIINEAFFTLEEGVSTKEEIDTAMRLGTNYPWGPFEWSEKIGIKNIFNLLSRLSKEQKRYEPSALLTREASI
jgi:3-hydroxybutyryl-CoA dehydrogenase